MYDSGRELDLGAVIYEIGWRKKARDRGEVETALGHGI